MLWQLVSLNGRVCLEGGSVTLEFGVAPMTALVTEPARTSFYRLLAVKLQSSLEHH